MTRNRNETGDLRASVAAIIDEYSSLGVKLTPLQILNQLVGRGLLNDTPDDYDRLLEVLPEEHGGARWAGAERQQRLNSLKDTILQVQKRLERGEPDLLEDIEAILRRALDERP